MISWEQADHWPRGLPMCDCFPCEPFDDEFELLRKHPKVKDILAENNEALPMERYSRIFDALKEDPLKQELAEPSMRAQDLLHPVDDLPIELFLNGDVRHREFPTSNRDD